MIDGNGHAVRCRGTRNARVTRAQSAFERGGVGKDPPLRSRTMHLGAQNDAAESEDGGTHICSSSVLTLGTPMLYVDAAGGIQEMRSKEDSSAADRKGRETDD